MQLNYNVQQLSEITKAQIFGEEFLPENFSIQNLVIDTRSPSVTERTLFVALSGIKEDGEKYLSYFAARKGKIALVKNYHQEIEICQLVVENPLKALQEIAAYHRAKFNIPIIAITGSNGKTIVKEWLYHTLKDNFSVVRSPKSYNSQIGVALSLLEITKDHEIGIFEAGISKPGEMDTLEKMIQPTVGVFTGIGDAHSANFSSLDEKLSEKKKLFKRVEVLFDNTSLRNFEIPFTDEASLSNASLVSQVAAYFKLDKSILEAKLKSLPAVSMRLEQLEGKNNCLLLNDVYSADIHSLEIALKHLRGVNRHTNKILILSVLEDNKIENIQQSLKVLLNKDLLKKVIFIGPKSQFPELNFETEYFDSTETFLSTNPQFFNATILLKGSRKMGLEKIVHHLADKKHITQMRINFSALRNNLNFFRSRLQPTTKILAMVKAQSYGSGLTEMAHFLVNNKVSYFGVAYADEGVQLRQAGITIPILVMNPEPNAFDEIINFNLEPSIYSLELLEAFIHELILRQKNHYPIHLKIETGMNRLGFVEEQFKELTDKLLTQPEVYVKSVFSHLAVADDEAENDFTSKQIRTFDILTDKLREILPYPFERHLANSAGTANFARAEYDMVRLGIGLFGLVDRNNRELENVLSLTTRISQVKKIKSGESVGYGRTYLATKDHLMGVIPVGYADGLRRGLSQGNWSVIVKGKKAPIIGNICMDMCMINLEDIDAEVGDEVEIFGDNNSIFEMASNLKTIPYEIIAGISSRVHRVYVDE